MKRIVFTVIVFFVALICCAQEHLTFKGIPITGSMVSFCQKLKAKGYTQIHQDRSITLFTGDFTGRKATIGVVAGDDGKNVFSVGVLFAASEEWNTLVNTYEYYKDLYTRKYGSPANAIENNPAYSDSNTAKMHKLYNGEVTWSCYWKVAGGEIEIKIEKSSGFYEGQVIIVYRDSQNVEAKIERDLEDI